MISHTTIIVVAANGVTAVLCTALLMLVLWQAPRRRSNQVFAFMMAALALYSGLNGFARFIDTLNLKPEPVFYAATTFYGIFIPSVFFFASEFAQNYSRPVRFVRAFGVVMFAIQFGALWTGHVTTNIRPVESHDGGYVWDYTLFGAITNFTMIIYLVSSIFVLYRMPEERGRGLWRAPALIVLSPISAALIWPIVPIPLSALFLAGAAAVLGQQVLTYELFDPLSQLHAKLAQRNAELQEASRLKTQFLTNVSHELRTPLNSIIGYTELVMGGTYGPVNETQRNRLEKVVRNGQNLLNLVNDVLDLNRIEAGRIALDWKIVPTPDLIESALAAIEPLATHKNLDIVRDFADAPPLYGDEMRARQIVTNILGNAVKFTHEGSITVRARGEGDQIRIEISDTGIGIAEDQFEAVFAEFKQADSSSTRQYEGTGLGMAITKRLVDLHGGSIRFTSAVGQGTTFIVYLPAATQAPPSGDVAAEALNATRVLVIDDSAETREMLADTLTRAGYRVFVASSGAEGLALAQTVRPHLITLDVLMPGPDGWDILRQIKSMSQLQRIPVVIVSIVDDRPLAMMLGAEDAVTKPIVVDQLLPTLENALAESGSSEPILVVDDAPDDRTLIADALKRKNYAVEVATGGADALSWLDQHTPRLILLDWVMPDVSGFDVLASIRRSERLAGLPVIVMTGKDLSPEEKAFLQDRCADLVRKGYGGMETFLRAVQSAVVHPDAAAECLPEAGE
jgi:signal transduction histidine kinase/DNA-binding response OmpR family regulator